MDAKGVSSSHKHTGGPCDYKMSPSVCSSSSVDDTNPLGQFTYSVSNQQAGLQQESQLEQLLRRLLLNLRIAQLTFLMFKFLFSTASSDDHWSTVPETASSSETALIGDVEFKKKKLMNRPFSDSSSQYRGCEKIILFKCEKNFSLCYVKLITVKILIVFFTKYSFNTD